MSVSLVQSCDRLKTPRDLHTGSSLCLSSLVVALEGGLSTRALIMHNHSKLCSELSLSSEAQSAPASLTH